MCSVARYKVSLLIVNIDWMQDRNLLPKDCSLCDYKALNHWNLKMHYASVHSSREERQNYKYYCNTCDLVFFCEAYYKKHNEGIRHKNMLKAIELQLKINGIVKNE